MGPNLIIQQNIMYSEPTAEEKPKNSELTTYRKLEIVYPSLFTFIYLYLAALYGLYLFFTSAKWATNVFAILLHILSSFGITAGSHRLWTHRTYKAKMPLQIILMILTSIACQYTVINWARDHRLHHKFSDTDADPHNSNRGLFFSHVGWLLVRKHPEITKRGKDIDVSDLKNNPVLKFQKKYALPVMGSLCFVLPTLIPMYFWNETFSNSWHVAVMLRYMTCMNSSFLVNSAAHFWGYKPYDKYIKPTANLGVAFFSFGEGFHNYHHSFPMDYRTAELGNNFLNVTTLFIDFFAKIGWAYDLRTVSNEMIIAKMGNTGDGTNCWGDRE